MLDTLQPLPCWYVLVLAGKNSRPGRQHDTPRHHAAACHGRASSVAAADCSCRHVLHTGRQVSHASSIQSLYCIPASSAQEAQPAHVSRDILSGYPGPVPACPTCDAIRRLFLRCPCSHAAPPCSAIAWRAFALEEHRTRVPVVCPPHPSGLRRRSIYRRHPLQDLSNHIDTIRLWVGRDKRAGRAR